MESTHGQTIAGPLEGVVNLPLLGKVMELVKSLQAMFLRWSEVNLAMIQVLGEHGRVSTHESKFLTNLMKVHYFNSFIKKELKV